jgi:hypothetical protein
MSPSVNRLYIALTKSIERSDFLNYSIIDSQYSFTLDRPVDDAPVDVGRNSARVDGLDA